MAGHFQVSDILEQRRRQPGTTPGQTTEQPVRCSHQCTLHDSSIVRVGLPQTLPANAPKSHSPPADPGHRDENPSTASHKSLVCKLDLIISQAQGISLGAKNLVAAPSTVDYPVHQGRIRSLQRLSRPRHFRLQALHQPQDGK